MAPPGYRGQLPEGLPVITAPTPYVWIIGRTQTNGPADYSAVNQVQAGYSITVTGQAAEHTIDPGYDTTTEPPRVVNGMDPLDFLTYAADLLAVNPPHPTDFSQLARLAHLGIVPGKPFDPKRFDGGQRADIEAGWEAALHDMASAGPTMGTRVNGWNIVTQNVGVYGNSYFTRAVVALVGLGANQPEDAIYPLLTADANGEPTTGDHSYVIHFDRGQLPPAAAFWSVTLYDCEGYQVANEINRFAIGDRDPLNLQHRRLSRPPPTTHQPRPRAGVELATRPPRPTWCHDAPLRTQTRSPRRHMDAASGQANLSGNSSREVRDSRSVEHRVLPRRQPRIRRVGLLRRGLLRGADTRRIDQFAQEGFRLLNYAPEAHCTPTRSALLR